jgi:hypothetical protein
MQHEFLMNLWFRFSIERNCSLKRDYPPCRAVAESVGFGGGPAAFIATTRLVDLGNPFYGLPRILASGAFEQFLPPFHWLYLEFLTLIQWRDPRNLKLRALAHRVKLSLEFDVHRK